MAMLVKGYGRFHGVKKKAALTRKTTQASAGSPTIRKRSLRIIVRTSKDWAAS